MTRKFRFLTASCVAAAAMLFTAACQSITFEPSETSIFIARDLSVTGAEFEILDNSAFPEERYTEEGLRNFIESEVSAYNREHFGRDSAYAPEEKDEEVEEGIVIEEYSYDGKTAKLILHYPSCTDYTAFNDNPAEGGITDLIIGYVQNGIDSGLTFEHMVNKEGAAADPADVQKRTEDYLVAVTGGTLMKVEGTLQYVSSGASIVDENTVQTPPDSTTYIVFK